ncbi:MAG: hypothetical protein LBL52_02785 [Rickettsiales bacterium]|jgi:hypothetical protein|nr:hypothetical protein [Rickettsiales bacterium]
MAERTFMQKNSSIAKFLLSSLKTSVIGMLIGVGGMALFAAGGMLSTSGSWKPGRTFEQWMESGIGVHAKPLADGKYLATDFSICPACGVLDKMFDMINTVAMEIYIMIHDIAWILLTMGFALWLLRRVYDDIVGGKGSMDDFAKSVFKKILIIFVIGAGIGFMDEKEIRTTANSIIEHTAVPILQAGTSIGSSIIDSPICDKLAFPASEATEDGVISKELKEQVLCVASSINIIFFGGLSAARYLFKFSFNPLNSHAMLDGLGGMIAALLLGAIFFGLYIWVPLMFVDIIFTLAILLAFVPLMIGGFAYEDTKKFSMTGIEALFGIAWRIIVYCIFLEILYQSLLYVGDAYYPGPVDGFTYMFPDFLNHSTNVAASDAWARCYNDNIGNAGGLKTCLAAARLEFDMPGKDFSVNAFMPVLGVGILSLMIMGNMKSYAGLVSGYMFQIGDSIKAFIINGKNHFTSITREYVGGIKKSYSDKVKNPQEKKLDKIMAGIKEKLGRRKTDE